MKETLSQKIARWFKPKAQKKEDQPKQTQTQNSEESEDNINEDSKGDFLALENEDLIFSEEE